MFSPFHSRRYAVHDQRRETGKERKVPTQHVTIVIN